LLGSVYSAPIEEVLIRYKFTPPATITRMSGIFLSTLMSNCDLSLKTPNDGVTSQ
jgi:hypothetical protein